MRRKNKLILVTAGVLLLGIADRYNSMEERAPIKQKPCFFLGYELRGKNTRIYADEVVDIMGAQEKYRRFNDISLLDRVFERADKNRDGIITEGEILEVLNKEKNVK